MGELGPTFAVTALVFAVASVPFWWHRVRMPYLGRRWELRRLEALAARLDRTAILSHADGRPLTAQSERAAAQEARGRAGVIRRGIGSADDGRLTIADDS